MNGSYFLLTNLLSEDEKRVITGIAAHIERGEKRVGIQQIASENFLSAASIVKMCKRLGFDGYSELYYYLSRQMDRRGERSAENLKTLVDNYSDELVNVTILWPFWRAWRTSLSTGSVSPLWLTANMTLGAASSSVRSCAEQKSMWS